MFRFNHYYMRACVYTCIFFAVTSCKDTDEFFSPKDKGNPASEKPYDFDFSTTRKVDLIVDYSAFDIYGPVLFSVYDTNPIVNANTDDAHINEAIEPIMEAYTDERGKFDQTITLPAYAKVLHIVTGNLAIGLAHSLVDVVNGEAKVVVENNGSTFRANAPRRAPGPGESTSVLGKLMSTAYEVNSSGNITSVQVYKEWGTPLGTWNSASGRPDYLMNKATAKPSLVLSDKEVKDMWDKVSNKLPSGKDNSKWRNASDLTLKKNSEVSITILGSHTCWNSTLGYYYYNKNNPPQNKTELNIIMLFPNTQDGQRDKSWNYQGNIGTERGDAIQLMFYPNIASNDPAKKYSGASKEFPAGTCIGFIMRANAWGMMGDEYCSIKGDSSRWDKKMNIWGSTTDGMSYAHDNVCSLSKPNPTGQARSAEFDYESADGTKYLILAFEDACDDYDYNDLVFALNPASAFQETEQQATSSDMLIQERGIYAFEDRWPSICDYDMNDVVVNCEHKLIYNSGKIKKERFDMTIYQNQASDVNGLAVRLSTKVSPSSIAVKRMTPSERTPTDITVTNEDGVYYLTDNVKTNLYTTYTLELTYSTPQDLSKMASIEPFLYGLKKDINGELQNWEVHIPGMPPTSKMFMGFFRTFSDYSEETEGKWYMGQNQLPFGFYLSNASDNDFIDNILKQDNEGVPINILFSGFMTWSQSKGEQNKDWYKVWQ